MLEGISGSHLVQTPKQADPTTELIFYLSHMFVQFCIPTKHPSKIRELPGTNLKLPVLR